QVRAVAGPRVVRQVVGQPGFERRQVNVPHQIDQRGLSVDSHATVLLLEVGARQRAIALHAARVPLRHALSELADGHVGHLYGEAGLGCEPTPCMYGDAARRDALGHALRESAKVLIVLEDGLPTGTAQDDVVDLARVAHAEERTAYFCQNLL